VVRSLLPTVVAKENFVPANAPVLFIKVRTIIIGKVVNILTEKDTFLSINPIIPPHNMDTFVNTG
jgi:hypothetical protein